MDVFLFRLAMAQVPNFKLQFFLITATTEYTMGKEILRTNALQHHCNKDLEPIFSGIVKGYVCEGET